GFYLLAILTYLEFDEDGRWRWYGLSLAAFLLALLSKSAVVMLPFVLMCCLWWKHGRVWRKDVFRIVPFIGLSLILGAVTVWFHQHRALVLGGLTAPAGGFLSRVAAAGWALWFYLYKAVLPFALCAIYPKWNVDASRWL